MITVDLFNAFDRCVVINLKRRQDRLVEFQTNLESVGWPHRPVEVVSAVDGGSGRVPCPPTFLQGGGAYGCLKSHLTILERALSEDWPSVLILEDDARFYTDYTSQMQAFMDDVPADWEALWIGGQHHGGCWTPKGNRGTKKHERVSQHVLRVFNVQRTHAYALRGRRAMQGLHRLWEAATVHCDWVLADFQEQHRVYSPDRFLAYQARSQSDISGRLNAPSSWNPPTDNDPIVWLRNVPKHVFADLRQRGFHSGFTLDDKLHDKGLNEAFDSTRNPRERRRTLSHWADTLLWEAAAMPEGFTTIWHADSETYEEDIRQVCGRRLVEITGQTADECMGQFRTRRAA